jgi:hypothetical protein
VSGLADALRLSFMCMAGRSFTPDLRDEGSMRKPVFAASSKERHRELSWATISYQKPLPSGGKSQRTTRSRQRVLSSARIKPIVLSWVYLSAFHRITRFCRDTHCAEMRCFKGRLTQAYSSHDIEVVACDPVSLPPSSPIPFDQDIQTIPELRTWYA